MTWANKSNGQATATTLLLAPHTLLNCCISRAAASRVFVLSAARCCWARATAAARCAFAFALLLLLPLLCQRDHISYALVLFIFHFLKEGDRARVNP